VGDRLEGKVAAVTGATSGIGRAAAIGFAAEGAVVIACGRNPQELERLAAELGPKHLTIQMDVASEPSVAAAFERVRERHGRLDVLYNCAGIQLLAHDSPVDRLELQTWNETLGVNLTGMFLSCKHGVQLMLERGQGSIINCGSPTGISGRGWRYHAYSTSKSGIVGLTKAMAAAYGPRGIRVNVIIPGTVRTGMTEPLFEDGTRIAELTQRTALRRLGEPEDLVGVAVFLASDESAYATGAMFVVDGGLLVT
jgi:NAD(P)-dependent dehydrogenase (short-subunit alcohol dehydrogenase family)